MFVEFYSVLQVAGETLLKLVPISIALGVVFAVLTHWSACNPGRPWWRKREIVTDVCYWFLIPLGARFVRIGLMVMGAAYLYNIHGTEALIKFYDNGFGPLAAMPLWAQALTFLVAIGFPAVLVPPPLSWRAVCGSTTRSIIPPKTSTGSRRRAFIRSISCSAPSWSTSRCCSPAFRRT